VLHSRGIPQLLCSIFESENGIEGSNICGHLPRVTTMRRRIKRFTPIDKLRMGIITPHQHAMMGGEAWALAYAQIDNRREYFEELARNLVKLSDWRDIAIIISKYKKEDLMFMQTCKLPTGLRRIIQLAAVVKTVREKWERGEEIVKIIVGSNGCS
jgi:hypothetical protein